MYSTESSQATFQLIISVNQIAHTIYIEITTRMDRLVQQCQAYPLQPVELRFLTQ